MEVGALEGGGAEKGQADLVLTGAPCRSKSRVSNDLQMDESWDEGAGSRRKETRMTLGLLARAATDRQVWDGRI